MNVTIPDRLNRSTVMLTTAAVLFVCFGVGYVLAVYPSLAILGVFGLLAVLTVVLLMSIGLYRQLCLFLALLILFTFATKVGYGLVNTTILALLPSAFLAFMVMQLLLLGAEGRLHFRWALLDFVVFAFWGLNLLQVLNPHLDIFSDQRFLLIGLRGFWQRSFMGLVYLLARGLIRSVPQINTVVKILAYTITLSSVYALMRQLFGLDFIEVRYQQQAMIVDQNYLSLSTFRSTGFLGSPFTFGMVSAIGVWCCIYLLNTSARHNRVLLVLGVVLNLMGLLLSGSRSTYFAMLVSIGIVLLLRWDWLIKVVWKNRGVTTLIVLMMIGLLAYFSNNQIVEYAFKRLNSTSQIGALFSGKQVYDQNFIVRQELATASVSLILQNPFGYGAGIFTGGANPESLVTVKGFSTWMDNEFSALALEMGVFGVVLLFMMMVMAVWRCWRCSRNRGERNRAIVLAALIVVCPAAGIGGQWMTAYPANVLFWLILGIIGNLPLARSTTEQARHRLSRTAATGGTGYERTTI